MKPIIINKNSNFVVITYWWGSGNKNKNTQRPCPEDFSEGDIITTKPKTFNKMIAEWKSSCRNSKCNYMAIEYPEYAQKGMYQKAINFKPTFILKALQACYPRSVLYIDGDMHIKKYPHIFDFKNVDYMVQGWNSDPRYRMIWTDNATCYYPYVFETSGGTMYFNNTPKSKMLLKEWNISVQKFPLKAEDRLISQIFNNKKLLLSINSIQLPIEYLWLSIDYDQLPKNLWSRSNVLIEHPECLTGEDRAFEGGASKNRYPPRYDYQITNKIHCRLKNMPFYEYIFFENQKDVNTMSDWLKAMNSFKLIKKIDYKDKYGPFNNIYISNMDKLKTINIDSMRGTIYLLSRNSILDIKNSVFLERKSLLIATIIKYLLAGNNVIYVPDNSRITMVNRVKNYAFKNKLSLVCRNKNKEIKRYKKDYTLTIDQEYPIFFGADSKILQHLLLMSSTLTTINKHFSSSFIFPSRIRCDWL